MYLNIDWHNNNKLAAIDSKGKKISYGQLCTSVMSLSCSIKKRTIILCLCQNSIDMLIGYLGFVEGGAVPIFLSVNIDEKLLAEIISIYKPHYIYAPTERWESTGNIVFQQGEYSLYETDNAIYPLNDKLALLMTTSGSTGSPKLVRYTRENLESNAKNVALAFGWTEKERPLIDLHMEYTMGLNVINTHLYVGATLLMTTDNIMSSEYWDFLKHNMATNITGVPFTYELMLKLRFMRMDLPYLTTLAQGGGKLADEDFLKFASYAKEKGKRFIPTFGTTETSARMTILPAELSLDKVGSIGKAIPGGEIFLIDDDGNVLREPEAEGEMCYRGPNVTMGYAVCAEDLIKGDEFNGEYHTGDIARRDEEGFYYVTGRKGRFLKLTGHRVSLDQCQTIIKECLGVECACTGSDDGMNIYAVSSGRSDEIVKVLSQKTGLFSSLFTVHEVNAIPRNETGKIMFKNLESCD